MMPIEPAPQNSIEYHLYKLENLFQTLYDLWSEKRRGARIGHRWLLALTGFTGIRAIPETPNAFPITLEVGSRICNTALKAVARERIGSPDAAPGFDRIEADIRYLRDLLIALHDLIETGGHRHDYPLEYDTARTLLSLLVDKPAETRVDELVDASFARGHSIATGAIETHQAMA